jgi:hypothetical protein
VYPKNRFPHDGKRLVLVRAAPIRVLAVDDLGLVLVELKPAIRQPLSDRGPQHAGLAFARGVDNHVIAVALEPDARILPNDPRVERVVQEHVGQQGRNRRTLRGSAIPIDQAAILALQWRFEPPLDVQPDPALIGVMSHRLQDEVPRDAIEEGPNVKIQHPVLPPTALPADPDRVQRRPTRPIPIGILMEHVLHRGLQVPGHDSLSDPVRDGRHP